MSKKILLMSLLFILILSGCNKKEQTDLNESGLTKKEGEKIQEIEKKDYKDLTKEEEEFVDKIEKNINNAEDKKLQEDIDLVMELEDLRDKKETGEAAKGSCNAISEASTCIEYIGSFWTEEQMKLNCKGSGIFSTKACPDDMSGGCNIGTGIASDMITWFYLRGGGEMNEISLKSAKNVCEMTPMSTWLISR